MPKGQRKPSEPHDRSAVPGPRAVDRSRLENNNSEWSVDLASLPDGALLWNPNGRLLSGNEALGAVFGEAPPWQAGQSFLQVARTVIGQLLADGEADGKAFLADWRKLRRRRRGHLLLPLRDGGTLMLREQELPDGRSMTLFSDVSALCAEDRALRQRQEALERLVGDLEMAQYKLEEQSASVVHLAEELSLAKREVERANQGKTNFLRMVSHELRTPLNSIIGFAELLRQETLGPIGHRLYGEYAGDILNSGQHLLNLVNHLLDLSRIEAGRYEIHLEEADIAGIADESLRLVRRQVADADVALERDLAEDLPPLRVDEQAVRQIVVNLLSNAIKFTPAGGHIHIRVVRQDKGVAIAVSDDGIGIPAHVLPRLMHPFERGDNNLGRRTEGIGLGLAISRALAELHGGKLTIESVNGQGTTATLWLPEGDPEVAAPIEDRRHGIL